LGEDPARQFARLLGGQKCDWNRVKFQGDKSQTCGRWVVLAIAMTCFLHYSPAELNDFVQDKSTAAGTTPDEVVASIISI
jgi:hypothetical protein